MTLNSLQNDKLRLLIVVKAKAKEDGFCYIGWDMDRHKLVRPVLRIRSFRWLRKDQELHIGEQHLFKIKRFDLEGTSYPHRTNDILVEYVEPYYKAADNSDVDELYDILIGQSRENVKEVFGNIDQFNGKYVCERTKCPSVGIYKCKRKNLKITPSDHGEPRCEIMEDGELIACKYIITAVDGRLPDVDRNEDILVILGLGRPYKGTSHQYTKLRCFVIIVGFVAEGLNANGINSGVNVPSPQSLSNGNKTKT